MGLKRHSPYDSMENLFCRKAQRKNKSLVVTIPDPIARNMGIKDGEYLCCAQVGNVMLVVKGNFAAVKKEIGGPDKYTGTVEAMMKQIADQEEEAERRAARAAPVAGQRPAGGPAAAAGPRPRSKLERLQFK